MDKRFKKKWIIWSVSLLAGIPLLLLVLAFTLRSWFLHKTIEKITHKLKQEKNLILKIDRASFTSLITVSLSNTSLVPENKDTLLYAGTITITPNLFSLLKGGINLDKFEIENLKLSLIKKGNQSNYSFLFQKKTENKSGNDKLTYEDILAKLLDLASDAIPRKVAITTFTCTLNNNGYQEEFTIPSFRKENEKLTSEININKLYNLTVSGVLANNLEKGKLEIISKDKACMIPFADTLFHLSSSFKKLKIEFNKGKGDGINYNGFMSIEQLTAFHKRLADDTVKITSCSLLFDASVIGNSLELDSVSKARLNNLTFGLYAKLEKDTSKKITLKVDLPKSPAQQFFTSLPTGMFKNLEGIKTEGDLSYKMSLNIDLGMPDSLSFYSTLTPYNLSILEYGTTKLTKINNSFEYTAFEKNVPVKSFIAGPENPDYYALNAVSIAIRNAILTSEDGGFFWHKGFNEEAITKSIAENIKKGKFARGGSTITMQLVKNVFLTRKKTMARKLEEILIVWLIENKRLCSKERMFEVYLNIIEFGPGVYGIGPACRFYFGKRPIDVTLNEALFLASILPRPKSFMYYFENGGHLKPFLADYFRFVSRILLSRKLITENEFNDLKPEIDLYQDARKYLKNDTLQTIDTTYVRED